MAGWPGLNVSMRGKPKREGERKGKEGRGGVWCGVVCVSGWVLQHT